MVSSKCCHVESPSPLRFLAALMPPWAQTECDRFTGTMENRSTLPPISAILITAESPASPPPTTMIFGFDAISLRFNLPGLYPELQEIYRMTTESFIEPVGSRGCNGVFKNEYIVTAPTSTKTSPIAAHTYPNFLRAPSPMVIPHFAAKSHNPYAKCQDAQTMPTA